MQITGNLNSTNPLLANNWLGHKVTVKYQIPYGMVDLTPDSEPDNTRARAKTTNIVTVYLSKIKMADCTANGSFTIEGVDSTAIEPLEVEVIAPSGAKLYGAAYTFSKLLILCLSVSILSLLTLCKGRPQV